MGQNYFDPFYSLIHQSLTIIFHEQQRSQLHPVDYLLIENCDLCHVINCYLQPNTAYNFMLSRSISDLTILTLIIQLQQIQSTLFASTCHAMPFPACVLKKKTFSPTLILWKKKKISQLASTCPQCLFQLALWKKTFSLMLILWKKRNRCSRQHVMQCLFQLALWKKYFLWRWYCGTKEITARVNMSCNSFSACALKNKNIFSDIDIVEKKECT